MNSTEHKRLAASYQEIADRADREAREANQAAHAARTRANQTGLAAAVLTADIPENALIEFIDWEDERDPGGSFDAMLTEAFDPESETSLCRVSDEVWTLTGRDDWAPFLVEHTFASGQTVRVVSVERVLAWAASWVPGSTTPQR